MHRQTDRRAYSGTSRQTIALASRETLSFFGGTLISAASFVIESNPCSDAPCTKVPQSCFIKLTHQFHETTHPPPPLAPPSPTHTHRERHTHFSPLHCRVHFDAFNETRQKANCEKLPARQKFNWNWKCARLRNGEGVERGVVWGVAVVLTSPQRISSSQTMNVCLLLLIAVLHRNGNGNVG